MDAFNDFLIQSRNHFLHMICSYHICSCMFLVWTLNFGFPLMKLLRNLLNSFGFIHMNFRMFLLVPSFLTVVLYDEHSDVLKHSNVIQYFEPYEGCLFIPFKNYLKHIIERSFVLKNKMILSLKSKRIFLCI